MEDHVLNGRKILVVEDDFSGRLYLGKVLEKNGALVLTAPNGAEAVEIVKQNPDIEVVLMDIQLPVMNGYEATVEILKIKNDMIVIGQSAYSLGYENDKVTAAGFTDYIEKPIMPGSVIAKIMKHLAKR